MCVSNRRIVVIMVRHDAIDEPVEGDFAAIAMSRPNRGMNFTASAPTTAKHLTRSTVDIGIRKIPRQYCVNPTEFRKDDFSRLARVPPLICRKRTATEDNAQACSRRVPSPRSMLFFGSVGVRAIEEQELFDSFKLARHHQPRKHHAISDAIFALERAEKSQVPRAMHAPQLGRMVHAVVDVNPVLQPVRRRRPGKVQLDRILAENLALFIDAPPSGCTRTPASRPFQVRRCTSQPSWA